MIAAPSEWGWRLSTLEGAGGRPTNNIGTSIAPGENTYGTYEEIVAGSLVSHDVYLIDVIIGTGAATAAARDILVTLGIDPDGGTSFSDFISHLMGSNASEYTTATSGGGVSYRFPIFLRAGSSIAAKASVNNVSLSELRVAVVLYGKPSNPEAVWAGSFVQTFGATPASSSGTALTPGEASGGAWVELGTLDKTIRHWEAGIGFNTGTFTAGVMHCDLGIGDATDKKTPIVDGYATISAAERLYKTHWAAPGIGAPGDKVYGRAQGSDPATANMSMIAYGVG